ncbi:hypothetical protein A2382_04120 [Candidatus Woesebacteria bacterium RIFOXYB1_FULL_38_16]|uniref:Uncharacterized protein n=1 Tax=Candidatus Woesebacteria bacterium RIFOXYB1_FULL_38_16 TaxID=1802538 RepID=A0A1F8CT25_9BACT|nr:MAG: hypothetical protein A2191_05115 [Candidatus Woesebacteria bacterium RIFOXYA1_FULL_38_9]OGM78725.1 MAG: hypothetical protein A2382_04120 [Candidatus Woesebacteria bacterium RIFOXYB1_FULL_38_16]
MKTFIPAIIALVFIVYLAVAGIRQVRVWTNITRNNAVQTNSNQEIINSPSPTPTDQRSIITKLKESLKLSGNIICEWKQEQSTGTLYLKGEKISITSKLNDENYHYLLDNNCLWTWTDKESTGIKLCEAADNGYLQFLDEESINENNLSCQEIEEIDPSIFNLPANKTFVNPFDQAPVATSNPGL